MGNLIFSDKFHQSDEWRRLDNMCGSIIYVGTSTSTCFRKRSRLRKSKVGKGCNAMLRKLNCFLNIVIGSFIGTFIGAGIYKFWHFKTYPNLYAMQSAPWYTALQLYGAMVAFVVVVCIILTLVEASCIRLKHTVFCLSQTAFNINGKGYAGINAPLTLALSVIRGSQAEHKDILLRTYLICEILQITASNKVFLYNGCSIAITFITGQKKLFCMR